MASTDRQVRRANRILATEIGSLGNGQPLLKWIWSQHYDLTHPIRILDDNGKRKFDYLCPCGKNTMVHTPECLAGSLVIAMPVWERRSLCPHIRNRWVVCRWLAPPSERIFREEFGMDCAYPANGYYAPVSSNARMIACKEGVIPSDELSWLVVRMFREHVSKSTQAHLAEIAAASEKADASHKSTLRDKFEDKMSAFAKHLHLPGEKGAVSLPTPMRLRGLSRGTHYAVPPPSIPGITLT